MTLAFDGGPDRRLTLRMVVPKKWRQKPARALVDAFATRFNATRGGAAPVDAARLIARRPTGDETAFEETSGYSVGTGRGAAAAALRIFRGDCAGRRRCRRSDAAKAAAGT